MERTAKQFIRRHLPSFAALSLAQKREVDEAVGGSLIALRFDGTVFFVKGEEVFVGWLERTDAGLALKATPPTRSLGTIAEYESEMAARKAGVEALVGSKVKIR